jgi:hypothetical protein
VIATWRPTVERANQALQEFREVAPGADLFDNHLAQTLPSQALTPWGRAREFTALLEQLGQGWQALATAAGTYIPQLGRPLILAELTPEQIATLGRNPKCDAVARLDVPLDLADTKTYAERTARLAQMEQERRDYEAAAPERARELRRSLVAIRIPNR